MFKKSEYCTIVVAMDLNDFATSDIILSTFDFDFGFPY